MKKFIAFFGLLLGASLWVRAQDVTSWLEQLPHVSSAVTKLVGKSSPFSCGVELSVTSKSDNAMSSASGEFTFREGNSRLEVRASDLKSPQISKSAILLLKQLNGENFSVLTRPDKGLSFLLFPGAQACLEQPLPTVKLDSPSRAGTDLIDGHLCSRERCLARFDGTKTNQLIVWRSKDFKGIPLRIEINNAQELFVIRFKGIHFTNPPAQQFQIPTGLHKYDNLEDLLQSVLAEKVRKKFGLE